MAVGEPTPSPRRGTIIIADELRLGAHASDGRHLAEIGFLLLLFAGIWLAAAQIPQLKLGTARTIIAGIALAIGGLLLVIALANVATRSAMRLT